MKRENTNLPGIEVQLLEQHQEKVQFHPEIEILYGVSGNSKVRVQEKEYTLGKNDIILVNSNFAHSVTVEEEAVLCKIIISYRILAEVVQDGNYVFYCNSLEDAIRPYIELQQLMKRIVLSFVGVLKRSECMRHGLVYELLAILMEYFRDTGRVETTEAAVEGTGQKRSMNKSQKSSERLQFIINYVNMNFQDAISLSQMAEEMYMSTSSLSRFFKKQTGIYFAEFVNQVRLNYAVRDLKETGKSITRVAIDCGFSNPSVFSKAFQQAYEMSPSDYRKRQQQEQERQKQVEESARWEKLEEKLLALKQQEQEHQNVTDLQVEVKISEGVEYKKFWNQVLNAGTAHNLSLANLQYHIVFLAEQLQFKYVRIWNIFSEKLMIQRSENDLNYNFNLVDNVLDFLVNHGLKPFIDFGKRPETAIASEEETVYYQEEFIRFRSQRDWENMFQAFLSHVIKRYGKEEVQQWIYEFTVDLRHQELVFAEEKGDLRLLFCYCYQHIKYYLPKAKIGGMGAVVDMDMERMMEWMEACSSQGCEPDFVSIMLFPYTSVQQDDIFFARRNTDPDFASGQVERMRERLVDAGFEKCRLYVTEWNNSLSTRNYLNDSCFRGAYIVREFTKMWDKLDMLGIWMGSDWVSSYYDTARVANGGTGLLTKDGIRKPAFYALQFLNRLGSSLIQKGDNYIVTTNDRRSFYILCHNCKEYSAAYYLQEENDLDLRQLPDLFENEDALTIHMELKGMPDHVTYVVKKHIVNHQHGSLLGEWQKFQFEKEMEGVDVKHLRDICIPNLNMEKLTVEQGSLPIQVTLEAQAMVLIHVYEA